MLAPGTPLFREYWVLTLIAVVSAGLFAVRWLTLPGRWEHPTLYVVASLIAGYYVAVWGARWAALPRMRCPRPVLPEPGLRVAVATTFVGGAEPLDMLEGTVRALLGMEYPHDTWVLDEGDDPEVRALCTKLGARHFTRRNDPAFRTPSGQFAARTKHGNYNAWLTQAVYGSYDIVVTFDPDHIPQPNYLLRLLGYFQDPGVGYVQAPPVYYNQNASFIARGAAEETYAYHSSHQMASYALGHPIVVGSHSLHRVDALQQVGGFPAHDAEDLYITMLYRANRWRGVYSPRIVALGATPVDWSGYLRQQVRWARAVVDLKLRAFPALASKLSRMERVLNLFHGVYYLRPLVLFLLLVMLLTMLVENTVPAFLSGQPLLAAIALMTVLQIVDRFRQRFYLDPERERGFHWRSVVLQVAKWPHLVSALLDAAFNRRAGYVITQKAAAGRQVRILTPPHLVIAALVLGAALSSVARRGTLDPTLWVLAGLTVFASLALVWTETWRYPAPYDPVLHEQRLQDLGGLSDAGPAASRAPQERRAAERRRARLPAGLPPGVLAERRRGERRRRSSGG